MAKTSSSIPRGRSAAARDRYLVFAFGIVFLGLILYLLVSDPTPSPHEFFAYRLTLALAAGGIGAMIPGLVAYRQRLPHDGALRVGGALALSACVWFTNPAESTLGPEPETERIPPKEDAVLLIERYLANNLDHAAVYDMFSSAFKASISPSAYAQLSTNIRQPLGKRIAGPTLMHSNFMPEMAGRKGPFVVAGYQSRFEGSDAIWIEWSNTVAENGAWRMDGYQVIPCVAPACVPLPALAASQ